MAILLDANMLILLFDEQAAAPGDPDTGQPVTHCQDRLRHFLDVYSRPKGARIIIPTPALTEFLVKVASRQRPAYVDQLRRVRGCRIAPFGDRAAIELAEMQDVLIEEAPARLRQQERETRAKAKLDQQIVAIARCEGVTTIYSADDGLGRFAKRFGIERVGVEKLPLPPKSLQGVLALEPPEVDPPEPEPED
jgi:predicted nucleic acid-binding protein